MNKSNSKEGFFVFGPDKRSTFKRKSYSEEDNVKGELSYQYNNPYFNKKKVKTLEGELSK